MRVSITAFICGVLFSIGLSVSGMTHQTKVIGFLDVLGDWDPSLGFVMAGGLLVNAIAFYFIFKRRKPVLAPTFEVPTRRDIDGRLLLGSAMFGAGWGVSGFCPGPAITGLGSGSISAIVFVAAMIGGMILFELFAAAPKNAPARAPSRAGSEIVHVADG